MAINSKAVDFNKQELRCKSLKVDGNAITADESAVLAGVTAGTATASKAVVLGASKEISTISTATITNLVVGLAGTISINNTTLSATGNDTTQTVTATKLAGTVTTGALTTAGGATTSVVITLPQAGAADLVFATLAGGTNTTPVGISGAVATTDTITITLRNHTAATALNGTVAFHYLWVK